MAFDYVALRSEIDTNPLSRAAYAGTDQEVADDMNTIYRDDPNPPTTLGAAVIWNALDPTEYDELSVADTAQIDFIGQLGSEELPISSGLIKNKIFAIFGSGTTSRNNIIALTTAPQVSRSVELGFGKMGRGNVEVARAL